ncbi:MAG: hypothetical protein A2138_16490 [Deltaproteobacteria bacterium RBG_16_71_12]|nr:MAG: hypothetical protein A2138_16490 [Deltaproteobacteria bacterium RBG_16_71_12]
MTDPGPGRSFLFFEPVLVRRIVSLGVPVIIGMLTQTAINQVDTLFVGRLDERTAVAGTAALGYSMILMWAFGGFLAAISVGTQAMTARRYGAGDIEGAGRVLANSLALALVSSAVVTVGAIAAVPRVFEWLHHDPLVRELGVDFCRVRFLGILGMVTTASLKSFYDGIGRVRVHMTVAIVMNLINLVLCWALVFGNLGAPRLEVAGAAWAASISGLAGTCMMLWWALRREDRRHFKAFRLENLDRAVAFGVARLSVFSGLATVFVMSGFAVFLAIVGRIDEREQLAGVNASAAQLIISVTMLIFMSCIAFGTSTATLVSQSLGAKKPGLAARYGWQSVIICTAFMAVVGVLLAAFPEPVLRVFLPADTTQHEALKDQVIEVATGSLRFCGLLAPIAAAALVLTQALYGAGESRFVMIAEGILHLTCLVPLAWVFSITLDLGLIGCWYATAIYGAALALLTGVKFARGAWHHTRI